MADDEAAAEAKRLKNKAKKERQKAKRCHYMIQPLVELYGGFMVVLKVP